MGTDYPPSRQQHHSWAAKNKQVKGEICGASNPPQVKKPANGKMVLHIRTIILQRQQS
jgi:hypothetical protein